MSKLEKPNKLTLDWLLRHDCEVYVRNMTKPRGNVVLNITLPNGKNQVVKIPKTFLPINLSEHAAPDVLGGSHDLKSYIRKGILDLIWPPKAEADLNTEEARDEMRRLNISDFSQMSKWTSKRQSEALDTERNAELLRASTKFDVAAQEAQTISPRVMQLVENYKSDDMSAKELLVELRAIDSDLTATDCSYLIANGPEGQVRELAQKVLARLVPAAATETSEESAGELQAVPSDLNISDDAEDEMTDEELQEEAMREAAARASQAVSGESESQSQSKSRRGRRRKSST